MKKNLRRTLVMSILALTLCIAMLAGSTFAWFTDTVVSGNNIIKTGNLDVVLEYKSAWSDEWTAVDETTKIFDDAALYEPGYTEVVFLRVANAGSLALRYDLAVNVASEKSSTNVNGEEFMLSDYLHIGTYLQDEYSSGFNYADIFMPTMFSTREDAVANVTSMKPISEAADFAVENRPLLPGEQTAQVLALVLHMPETVGNEANHASSVAAPEINLGINVFATQFTHEDDAFDNMYDKDATYPVNVATAEELKEALAAGKSITLTEDLALTETITVPAGATATLNLNGKTITAPAVDSPSNIAAIHNEGNLTIEGEGTITGDYAAVYSTGNLTVNGGNFTSPTGFGLMVDNIYGTEASVAVINGGTFAGFGIYNPTEVTINGGTFNVGRDPDGATDHLSDKMTLFVNPTFTSAPNTANVTLNGGTFNGDIYVYDDGITETVFVNNGATVTGSILDNG